MQTTKQNTHPFNLGKYIIFPTNLGKGTFGEVFLAKDKKGTMLAAKCISNKKIFSSNDSTQKIINEISLYSKLKHRNIIKLKDVLLTQDETYLILEHCNCENLQEFQSKYKEVFKHNPTMKVTQIIFTQIIEGLYYMSTEKCIHRDLKLDNIMLSENQSLNMSININDKKIESYFLQSDIIKEKIDNNLYFDIPQMHPKYWDNEFISDENTFENHLKNYVIKIIDLGLGKRFSNEIETTSVCGNLVGISPEIWKILQKESQTYSGDKVDLWSLGIILYHFAFKELPFKGENWIQLSLLYENGTYTVPNVNENPITVEFLDLLSGLLRIDPQQRYKWDTVKNHPFIRKPIDKQKIFKFENSNALTLDITNNSQQFLSQEELNEYCDYVEDNPSQPSDEDNIQNVEFRKYLIEIFKYKKHIIVPMETTITPIDDEWSLLDNKVIESPKEQKKSFIGKIFSYLSSYHNQ